MKKTMAMLLAVSAVGALGFTACGDKGGNGEVKGEAVTASEWATAIDAAYSVDNVTIIETLSVQYGTGEEAMEGTATGTTKIADDQILEAHTYTEKEEGVSETWTEDLYTTKIDGVYYRYYRDSIDTLEWEKWDSDQDDDLTTLGGYVLSNYLPQADIATYEETYADLTFNESTGEYSIVTTEQMWTYTYVFKFLDGKLYSFAVTWESEGDYEKSTYVFTDYGTTTVTSPLGGNGETSSEESAN